jgi:hypothetical protein
MGGRQWKTCVFNVQNPTMRAINRPPRMGFMHELSYPLPITG